MSYDDSTNNLPQLENLIINKNENSFFWGPKQINHNINKDFPHFYSFASNNTAPFKIVEFKSNISTYKNKNEIRNRTQKFNLNTSENTKQIENVTRKEWNIQRNVNYHNRKNINIPSIKKKVKTKKESKRNKLKRISNSYYYQKNFNVSSSIKLKPSITIKEEWGKPLLSISFVELIKVLGEKVTETKDIKITSPLRKYNLKIDKITPKNPISLIKYKINPFTVDKLEDDTFVNDLSLNNSFNIYITDVLLSTLMLSYKSKLGWDLIIIKNKSTIIFDERDNSKIYKEKCDETNTDIWWVNSNDSSKSMSFFNDLCNEATDINYRFSRQVSRINISQPSKPIFKYKSFTLEKNKLKILVKCNLSNCTIKGSSDNNNILIYSKALNENNIKASKSWKNELTIHKGGVIVDEIRKNSFRMARMATQASICGAREIRLGFIARKYKDKMDSHMILSMHKDILNGLLKYTKVSMNKNWGIFNYIVDKVKDFEDGRYLIIKDPNYENLDIYRANDVY